MRQQVQDLADAPGQSTRQEPCPDGGARRSIEAAGVHHRNPVPAACVVNGLLVTGALTGRDPESGEMPASLDAQMSNVFGRVRDVLTAAGAGTDAVAKLTVWLADTEDRGALNREWSAMFPDADDRPARQVLHGAQLADDALVHCEVLAMLDRADAR